MRDMFGFIPLYTAGMLFALWFAGAASFGLGWAWLSAEFLGWPWWLLIPLVAALADYLEDACHLSYLRLHATGRLDRAWVWLVTIPAAAMTAVKYAAFVTGSLAAAGALAHGTIELVVLSARAGWRAIPALAISSLAAAFLVALAASIVAFRFFKPAPAPMSSH